MGRYIEPSDIYDVRIYGLSSTVVDTEIVSTFLEDSESIVDSFISKRYSMPIVPTSLTNVPVILAKITKDLTAYELLNYLYSQQNQNVNNWVVGMGEGAYNKLKMLADDTIRIVYSAGTVASMDLNINMESNLEGIPPIFNMDSDYNTKVSSGLLDIIDTGRQSAS